MDAGVDTGPVYRQEQVPLDGTETAADLERRLAELAGRHIVSVVQAVCRQGLKPEAQPEDGVTYAGRIRKQDGRIDWRLAAEQIERRVRAYSPWPGAYSMVPTRKQMRRIVITRVRVLADVPSRVDPGTVLRADRNGWDIACGTGGIRIERLVPEGRGEMTSDEFLRGTPVACGTQLSTQSPSS
jgi:methionyl-tRNA formyltransferase